MAERITREHLGTATDQDVAEFEAAVQRILPAFNGDAEAAERWLWGNGDYLKRIYDCPGAECAAEYDKRPRI